MNFKDFLWEVLKERKDFLYPPYKELVQLEYRNKDSKKALAFTQKLEQKMRSYDTDHLYTFLRGTSTFKKNNSYHTNILIKWENIRNLLENIESTIIRESGLSVIFH